MNSKTQKIEEEKNIKEVMGGIFGFKVRKFSSSKISITIG